MKLAVVAAAVALAASSLGACSQSSPPVAPAPSVVEVQEDEPGTEAVTLEGTLYVDEAFTHPNGTKPRPYILRLDTPRSAPDGETVSEVHVGPVEGLDLRAWVGRRVRVAGTAMPAMTAWHARPIVVLASSARPAF